MTASENMVVTQADREQASAMWRALQPLTMADFQADWMQDGTADYGLVVQAFARHRITAEQSCETRVREFADFLESGGDDFTGHALNQELCCSGRDCGCYGASIGSYLAHHLRAALSNSTPVREVEGWRTIDSAPRNPAGTFGHNSALDIDLWHNKQGRLADCFWWEEHSAWFSRSGGRAYNMGGDENFSHWMPLPDAPSTTSVVMKGDEE